MTRMEVKEWGRGGCASDPNKEQGKTILVAAPKAGRRDEERMWIVAIMMSFVAFLARSHSALHLPWHQHWVRYPHLIERHILL